MPDTVTAPSGPKTRNQKLLLYGGIGVGGIAGYIWYRKNKTTSTASQGTVDPNAIDPNTGIPYADEGSYGGIGVTPGALGQYNPLTGQYVPGYGSTPVASIPATNAQWAAAAEATLVADGYDPATVAAALGLYLAGQPLTADQYTIVQAAIGMEGQPPVSVPPPHQQPPSGQTVPQPKPVVLPPGPPIPGNFTGTVSVPNVVGMYRLDAIAKLASVGLTSHLSGPAVSPISRYKIVSQTPGPGTRVNIGSVVDLGYNKV